MTARDSISDEEAKSVEHICSSQSVSFIEVKKIYNNQPPLNPAINATGWEAGWNLESKRFQNTTKEHKDDKLLKMASDGIRR